MTVRWMDVGNGHDRSASSCRERFFTASVFCGAICAAKSTFPKGEGFDGTGMPVPYICVPKRTDKHQLILRNAKLCMNPAVLGTLPQEVKYVILSYFRTIVLYLLLIFSVRLMGKRQIGEMEPTEFVVTMLVANLAAIPMQDGGIPLLSGLIPILTVLGMELVLSGAVLRSIFVRRLLCGKPVILVDNGNILQENLRRTRITLDELVGHLREKNVLDLRSVQYAILETNGNLSVFPYPKEMPANAKDAGIPVKAQHLPITIIEDGYVSRENLRRAGKSRRWVDTVLQEHKATVEQTWLLTVDDSDKILWIGKEDKK